MTTRDERASTRSPVRVDAHHHLWDLDVVPQTWIEGPALAPLDRSFTVVDLEKAVTDQVDRTVVVQTIGVEHETPWLLQLAEQSELIGAVVGWVDLTAPDVADRLASLQARPDGRWLAGIRHQVQGEPDPEWLNRAEVRAGLQAVGNAGLTYDLLTLPEQLPAAIETASALPEVHFVVDHLSKPPIASGELEPWATRLRELARRPNVTCKLSGMVTEADWATWTVADLRPYAEVVLDAFGPQRTMFGSDWPVCRLAADYDRVLAAVGMLIAGCSADEQAAIMGGTASRFYGLEAGADGADYADPASNDDSEGNTP